MAERAASDLAGSGSTDLVTSFDRRQPASPLDEDAVTLLGGKGHGLARMASEGLPVPPGFTLTTIACRRYLTEGWSGELTRAVEEGLHRLEATTGRRLGGDDHPLLVSVRSGAAVSMPGMLDTVLDVGMTTSAETALAAASGDDAFAVDTHRRFLTSYAEVVGGVDRARIADLLADPANAAPVALRTALAALGAVVPDDSRTQLLEAIQAVFRSWNLPRASAFREHEGIDETLGTAVTVQAMVFGNLGEDSGTGVAFTRHPSTGERGLIGEFLVKAQGGDVVAGSHTTLPLSELSSRWPEVYEELDSIGRQLELDYADMVDIEFTIERATLWILQARVGTRSPEAMFRAAVEMANDADFPVDRSMAVERCRALLDDPPTIGSRASGAADGTEVLATGVAASTGRVTGVLCTDIDDAVARSEAGDRVILAREETSPADVHGLAAACGLVTALGGLVSHAAVVARAWGIPAVVGIDGLEIDATGISYDGRRVVVGSPVTLDGDTGQLLLGHHPDLHGDDQLHPDVTTIRAWADELDG